MNPLAKFPDETDAEYAAFMAWALSKPRRAPSNPDLAARNDWATRATMFDAQPTRSEVVTPQPVETGRNLQRLLALEVAKLLTRSESAPSQNVLAPHELLRLVAVMTGGGKVTLDQGSHPVDGEAANLEDLSDEELEILAKMSRVRG